MNADTKSLTQARQWLVRRMHQAHYGTMHDLVIKEGEPILDPPPKTKQSFKLGGKRATPRAIPQDFALKEQHLELFELMDAKQNGVITKLTIQDGLPYLVEWEAA